MSRRGKPCRGDEKLVAIPAFRLRVQQGDKIRAAGDMERSETDEVAAIHTPINLPKWGHVANTRKLFRRRGIEGKIGMARAEHRNASKRLPFKASDQHAAAVPVGTQGGGECYRIFPAGAAFRSYRRRAPLR